MRLWIDAQLPPSLALFLRDNGYDAIAVRDLGLRDADDQKIFMSARMADAIVITKDSDFIDLLHRMGSPPKVLWLTCGNTSYAQLRSIFGIHLKRALDLFGGGEILVEIGD
jgi:predicted nuclease of predicted toxin-antitoxin system